MRSAIARASGSILELVELELMADDRTGAAMPPACAQTGKASTDLRA
jgi:hypothetical protein